MKPNTIEPMPKTAAEKKAYDHYHRVYLGENGGPTKGEMVRDIIGGILFFACLAACCYGLCLI